MKSKKHAFTLAEVLITLGIIGVVAAMTIPTLINNYQKNVTLTRLKHTYSTLSQMFALAEVDYGPMDTWGLEQYAGIGTNAEALLNNFDNNYMLPYLAGATRYDKQPISQIGYSNGIKYPNGDIFFAATKEIASIRLKNGVIIFPYLLTNKSTIVQDANINVSIVFIVDINGTTGENTVGKDVFAWWIVFVPNTSLQPVGIFDMEFDPDANTISITGTFSRDKILEKCKNGSNAINCGALIQLDGWKISDDYPWF